MILFILTLASDMVVLYGNDAFSVYYFQQIAFKRDFRFPEIKSCFKVKVNESMLTSHSRGNTGG